MLKEFKEFALKGNIVDLAIGVVIGGAFQQIVTSLVNDIIMPLATVLTGKVDFSDLVFTIGNTPIKYGNFITQIVNFLIIAFSIFLVVRYINKLNKISEQNRINQLEKLKGLGDDLASKIDKSGKYKKRKNKKAKIDEKPEIPTTKICPYCLSEVNYKATRCPHCTSILEEAVSNEEQETTNPEEKEENI
jgi:large conductance mechanosensitive channel